MKKKILAMCLVVALLATAIVGATLAYFTDTDSATNVMTLGDVDIIQNEDFVQDTKLLPMVDNRTDKTANPVVNGYFDPAMENVVKKEITVTNDGSEAAYVRTIILFETNAEYEAGTNNVLRDEVKIFDDYIGCLGKGVTYTDMVVEIDGVKYVVAYKVYENALAAGATSDPSLKQIFMSPDADNEISILFGSEYTVLALSQGVQAEGFTNGAAAALNEAFGEITAANVTSWF